MEGSLASAPFFRPGGLVTPFAKSGDSKLVPVFYLGTIKLDRWSVVYVPYRSCDSRCLDPRGTEQ